MSHTATIKYDRPLVRRALNRFMVKRLGESSFLALLAVTSVFLFSYFTDSWTWPLTYMAIAIAAALAFLSFVYYARLRAAEGFFDKANDPTVTLRFTSEGVRTESDLGSTDLKWKVFEEILRFPDVWLLVYAKSGYMTLPLDQLTPECSQFIEQQMIAHKAAAVDDVGRAAVVQCAHKYPRARQKSLAGRSAARR